jgi:polyisoprenoid-binding protein YceI
MRVRIVNRHAVAVLAVGLVAGLGASAASSRVRYQVDLARSHLVIKTETTGLSSMFGHDHAIQADAFSGEVHMSAGAPETAALDLSIVAGSLHSIDDLHPDLRWEIDTVMRDKVLETGRYPTIRFQSRKLGLGAGTIGIGRPAKVDVTGELQLHGVRRTVTVPMTVTLQRDGLRASGTVAIKQTDFGIALYTFADGNATVSDKVTLTFDVVCVPDAPPALN